MLRTELLELIASGESSGLEFKRDDLRPEQVAIPLVAMANFQGGRVLLGVEDNGAISGLARPNTEEWVMDTVLAHFVHPQILPFYEEVALEDGKRVGVISIQAGVAKPYVVRVNGREEIYIRVGSTSRRASREQQARLFASGVMLHPETMAVPGTGFADLSAERLSDYLVEYLRDAAVPVDAERWEARLSGLGLMASEQDGRSLASIAGVVLFGRNPRRALRQAGVRWMAFDGPTKDYNALDDVVLDGPMCPLTRRSESGAMEVVEPGLLDRVLERMTPFVSAEDLLPGELRRERRWAVPAIALREALLNAVVHRDWTRNIEVEVVAYSDRLEITSPGALQNSMTIEKMLAGQRSPRNSLMVDVMRDYGYVDARGMGVRLKIVPLVRALSGREAEFQATEDFVRLVIPKLVQET